MAAPNQFSKRSGGSVGSENPGSLAGRSGSIWARHLHLARALELDHYMVAPSRSILRNSSAVEFPVKGRFGSAGPMEISPLDVQGQEIS